MRRLLRVTPLRLVLALTLALAVVYVPLGRVPLVAEIESELLDLRFRLRGQRPPSEQIVLVLIDDESIRKIGRWPWDRAVLADLMRAVRRHGPRAVGMDLLFLEPEDLGGPGVAPGDRALAEALATGPGAIIPFSFTLQETPTAVVRQTMPEFLEDAAIRVVQGPARGFAPEADGVLVPIAVLGRAAAGLGHSNIGIGPAGQARFEYPVIRYQDAWFPSFALELARQALGVARSDVRIEPARGVHLGPRLVPTDENGRMVVNHGPASRFRWLSAHALLAGEADPRDLAGRVVLIGAVAAGLGSTFPSPFSTSLPGVARHAIVVDNILEGNFVVRRAESDLATLAGVVVGGLFLGAVAGRGLPVVTLSFLLLVSALVALDLHLFASDGLWLPLFLPVISLLLLFGAIVVHRQVVEGRQRRILRAAFRHYLSPALVEQVAADPALLRLGGEEREVTVMFADVRNSTGLAARLTPERFVHLLNDAFAVMSEIVFAHHGMLDKFTGDGMIAVFGAPLPRSDHAEMACRTALAIQAALPPVRDRWQQPDLPPLEVGIGINTGTMIIGNMGSPQRFDYTVIGEEASLGARLEAANKDFGTKILISEATWRQARHVVAAREVDLIRFRGMERHVAVYELLGLDPLAEDEERRLQSYRRALDAARAGHWSEARSVLQGLLEERADDRIVRLHLARCEDSLGPRNGAVAHGPAAAP